MKKIFIFAVSALVSATAFTAFAADPAPGTKTPNDKSLYKVYTNEAIGAGDKVYHITACAKAPAYVPLRCTEENKLNFAGQCNPEGKFNDGALIKGCKGNKNSGQDAPNDAVPNQASANLLAADSDPAEGGSSPYPVVNTAEYENDNTCANDPDRIGYYYVPELAVIAPINSQGKKAMENPEEYWIVQQTIPWEEGEEPSQDYLNKIIKDAFVAPLYRATLCVTWDELAEKTKDGTAAGTRQLVGAITGNVLEFYNSVRNQAQPLIDAGCNNDNSGKSIGNDTHGIFASTPTNANPTFTCTIKERISGKDGVDLFSNYIGGIYRWVAGVGGMIAVLIIVISGIQISASGENAENLSKAKERIAQSLIGLALLFLSGAILYAINPTFFTGG